MPPEPAQVYSTYHRDGNWVWITCRARNSHGVLGNCWVVAGSALRWLTDNNEQRAGAVVQRRSSKLAGLCTSRRHYGRSVRTALTGTAAFHETNPASASFQVRLPEPRDNGRKVRVGALGSAGSCWGWAAGIGAGRHCLKAIEWANGRWHNQVHFVVRGQSIS